MIKPTLICLLLSIFCSSIIAETPRTELVTMAILTQPAVEVLRQNFYQNGESFTFTPGSLVDYVGSAGSMPVLITFDMNIEKLEFLLGRTDSLLISSPEADLLKDGGEYTPYMKSVWDAIRLASERNSAGSYYPILALGNGMDALMRYSTKNPNTIKCNSGLDNTTKAINIKSMPSNIKPEWKDLLTDKDHVDVLGSGDLYFENQCSTTVADFEADSSLSDTFDILATSADGNYVEIVKHKQYPFYGFHFHPEKHIFERGDPHAHLDRSEKTTEFVKAIMLTFSQSVRERGQPKMIKQISSQVKQYFAMFRPSELPVVDRWERIITYQQFHDI